MLARLNHTRLLRYAGLFTWGVVAVPLLSLSLAPVDATGAPVDGIWASGLWKAWSAHAAFDEASYRATLEAIGEVGMLKLLDRLAERLRSFVAAEPSREALKTRAHQLASAAGALGFEAVADVCRELEEACDSGTDVTALTRQLDDACASALFEIEKFKAALFSTGRAQ